LLSQQPGLTVIEVTEEESRRHAEGARHSLDQLHLRVGRLPVPQLPDRGVRDPLARGPLDQAGDLGVAAGAAAGRATQ